MKHPNRCTQHCPRKLVQEVIQQQGPTKFSLAAFVGSLGIAQAVREHFTCPERNRTMTWTSSEQCAVATDELLRGESVNPFRLTNNQIDALRTFLK